MSAEVTIRANGKAEMAALEDVAVWWESEAIQAGRLKPNASIEDWIQTAGMEFLIRKSKISYAADRAGKDIRTLDDQVVLSRSDTGEALGIVGAGYQVVQPFEVLEFFRDLVATQGYQLTTAGTLFGGRKFWALARVTEAVISGWDKVGAYVLLTTSADGSMSTELRETTVSVVCANTLRMALEGRAGEGVIRMSHRSRFDAKSLQSKMGLTADHFDAFVTAANALTKMKVSTAAAEAFVMQLLKSGRGDEPSADGEVETPALVQTFTEAEMEEEVKSRKPRGFDAILELFEGAGRGSTQKGRVSTAWGLVNAVTEYVDHHATAKSDEHRAARAWYGTGDGLKVEAMRLATEMFV